MTPSDRQAARGALAEGRAVYLRLDQIRGPEDAAADIIDLWAAAERAMRAALGGSVLSGQTLVHDLRQRGIVTLDQANALAAFWDAKARTSDVGYKPTLTDVGYARAGYNAISQAVDDTSASVPPPDKGVQPPPPAATSRVPSAPPDPVDEGDYDDSERQLSTGMIAGIVAAIGILAVIVAYFAINASSYDKQMSKGMDLMASGQVEAARAQFVRVAQDHPDQSNPHVFLSRLSRNDGDLMTARQELDTAIRLAPSNATALREMGILLLAEKNPDLARRFLVRAITIAPADSAAQGYLGCALLRLNRADEAQHFFSRAGSGSWNSCATVPAPRPPSR